MGKKLSVILPCYNEESIIEKIIKELLDFSKNNKDYEFIFVDDGSKDNTLDIIEKTLQKSKNKFTKVSSYTPNKGKGYAIKEGVRNSQGDLICFIDSDLAYSLDHLERLRSELQKYDVVIGSRGLSKGNERNIKFSRILAGRVYNIFSRIILGLPYTDMQAGIKGYRKDVAKDLFSKQKLNDFAFDVEVIYLAKKKGYKIGEIPARVSEEHKNQISQVNLIRDSLKMFLDLIKIKLNDLTGKYE